MRVPSLARAVLMILALASIAPLLSACNTAAGAGQDVSATGAAVTNSANQVKSKL